MSMKDSLVGDLRHFLDKLSPAIYSQLQGRNPRIWCVPDDSPAIKILKRMGWKGGGLGRLAQGRPWASWLTDNINAFCELLQAVSGR